MSLNIETKKAENTTITLEGRLDTATAPELETLLDQELPETTDLVFDMDRLEYISSAGLRVLLKAQKAMNAKGSMKLLHVHDSIMDIFEITGFIDFLTIE